MAAPLTQNALTPWTGYTFGRLRELALRQAVGVSDRSSASPDSSLPEASAEEIALMGGFLHEGIVELQRVRDRLWPLSEASLTAEQSDVMAGTYPSVLLPADFGSALRGGFSISGVPIGVMTPEDWLNNRRPDADGGGTTLTDAAGDPTRSRALIRIMPQRQASNTAVWRLAAWLYPLQTAAWTLDVTYRATAKNHTTDTWSVRLPDILYRPLLLFCAMRAAEHRGDVKGAVAQRVLYQSALSDVENIPAAEEVQHSVVLAFPMV